MAGAVCWLIALPLVRHPVLHEILAIAASIPIVHRCIPARFRVA